MNNLSLIADGVGATILGFSAYYGGLLWRRHRHRLSVEKRVQEFTATSSYLEPVEKIEKAPLWSNIRQMLFERQKSKAKTSTSESKTAESLARADLKLRVGEWYLIRVLSIVVLLGIGVLINQTILLVLILGLIGAGLPSLMLVLRQRKRLHAFNNQLGDVLMLLSNALKAGQSFPQAMAAVGISGEEPIASEFIRATKEIQLGIGPNEALSHMVERIKSEDLDLVVTATQIQREVGGNLAEILENIAFTIRERVRIKGEIRSLTAQARASSYIITGLPIFLLLVLQILNPSYMEPLLNFKGPGPYILGGCAISIGLAFYIMQQIANIEV